MARRGRFATSIWWYRIPTFWGPHAVGMGGVGHVHGDRLADLPLPRKLHDEVIAAGRASPHHVLPDSGWVSCWMKGPEDAAAVIELFRLQYERYSAA